MVLVYTSLGMLLSLHTEEPKPKLSDQITSDPGNKDTTVIILWVSADWNLAPF